MYSPVRSWTLPPYCLLLPVVFVSLLSSTSSCPRLLVFIVLYTRSFPFIRTMARATKRKRTQAGNDDKQAVSSRSDLEALLSSAITDRGSAEVAVLTLMKNYRLNARMLQRVLIETKIDISFSNVEYEDIAPFVGLDPYGNMGDIEYFPLNRSRIPTSLFKRIVDDMDVMLVQYGPPTKHETEEATSRFMAPVFNRLIQLFGFVYRNVPEKIIQGRVTTKGRVEFYFTALNSTAILCIEVKRKISNDQERARAVAQVIAECDACDWHNEQRGFDIPVYGILCDGETFDFFVFERTGVSEPFMFRRGSLGPGPNNPPTLPNPMKLPDLSYSYTAGAFIGALRPICEVIFDLLLRSYISSLKAYYHTEIDEESEAKTSLIKWKMAISTATEASSFFRIAERLRQIQKIERANEMLQEAMVALQQSIESITALKTLKNVDAIMSGWVELEIELV